jgi:exosortase/archaeosortase family protein
MLAISVHDVLVPASYSPRPFYALAAFATLVFVRRRSLVYALPRLSAPRVMVFVCAHLLLLVTAYYFAGALQSSLGDYSLAASVLAAGKVVVVLPILVLFPADRRLLDQVTPELLATLIVLFTYFPGRYFQVVWPAYSQLLVAWIGRICTWFVPGTQWMQTANGPLLVGPSVDMTFGFACSGIAGVNLFQLVFGIVLAIEWTRIHKVRALICYACGLLVYLFANALRLITLFVFGNRISPKIDLDTFGWVLFALTFWAILRVSYDWMVPLNEERQPVTAAPPIVA